MAREYSLTSSNQSLTIEGTGISMSACSASTIGYYYLPNNNMGIGWNGYAVNGDYILTTTGGYNDERKRPKEIEKSPFLQRLIEEHEERCGGVLDRLKEEF